MALSKKSLAKSLLKIISVLINFILISTNTATSQEDNQVEYSTILEAGILIKIYILLRNICYLFNFF